MPPCFAQVSFHHGNCCKGMMFLKLRVMIMIIDEHLKMNMNICLNFYIMIDFHLGLRWSFNYRHMPNVNFDKMDGWIKQLETIYFSSFQAWSCTKDHLYPFEPFRQCFDVVNLEFQNHDWLRMTCSLFKGLLKV